MKIFLRALLIACATMTIALPPAMAQTTTTGTAKKTAKKAPKKASSKKKVEEKAAASGTDEDQKEPDITGSTTTDYQCELGNSLTIYENLSDENHVALRWKKKLLRMTRIETTTGAKRFENRGAGLVWIGIPSKGILLDKKKGLQLANECKNAEQSKPKSLAEEPVPALGITDAPLPAPAAPALPAAPMPVEGSVSPSSNIQGAP